jgi:hypothetical protein
VQESQWNVGVPPLSQDYADFSRFQWVKLQLTFFLKATGKYQIVLPSDFEKELVKLEKQPLANAQELYKIYDTILDTNSAGNSDGRMITTFIYQWIICSFDVVRVEYVLEALSALEPIVFEGSGSSQITHNQILQLVQNIVCIYHGRFLFAHASIPEYLQEKNSSDFKEVACHARMARTCIEFLMNPYPGSGPPIPKLTKKPEYWRKRSLRYHPQPIWAAYASLHFFDHCKALSKDERQSYGIHGLLIKWIVNKDCSVTLSEWPGFQLRWSGELEFSLAMDLIDIVEAMLSSPKHRECCLSPEVLMKCLQYDFGTRDRPKVLKLFAEKIIEVHPHNQALMNSALLSALRSSNEQAITHFLQVHPGSTRNAYVQRTLHWILRTFPQKETRSWNINQRERAVTRISDIVMEIYPDEEELTFLAISLAARTGNQQVIR